MSVLVLIDLKFKPESIMAAKALLQQGLPQIHDFDGCQDATLHVNQDDIHNLMFVEHWESQQHYERYRAWRAERGDNARLVSMLAEPLMVRCFEVVK